VPDVALLNSLSVPAIWLSHRNTQHSAQLTMSEVASASGSDEYVRVKFIMERAHETLLIGLESIKRQVLDDHTADLGNWLGYVGSWTTCVADHHGTEEAVLFPEFKKHGIDVDASTSLLLYYFWDCLIVILI
jgi:hypothetical protein